MLAHGAAPRRHGLKADGLQPSKGVRVRIVKQPTGTIQGISLNAYQVGCVYDMPSDLASYLVVQGFARFEMRKVDDRRRDPADERRKPWIQR